MTSAASALSRRVGSNVLPERTPKQIEAHLGKAIQTIVKTVFLKQGGSLRNVAAYQAFGNELRGQLRPVFKGFDELSQSSSPLAPIVEKLITKTQEVVDGRVSIYVGSLTEGGRIELGQKAPSDTSHEICNSVNEKGYRALVSVPVARSEDFLESATKLDRLLGVLSEVIDGSFSDPRVSTVDLLGVKALRNELDLCRDAVQVPDWGLEAIQRGCKEIADAVGLSSWLSRMCTMNSEAMNNLALAGREKEATLTMQLASSIKTGAAKDRIPEVDYALIKTFQTLAYMYSIYGMVAQTTGVGDLGYKEQRYAVLMNFFSKASKGNLHRMPKKDMLFMTMVLAAELKGLSAAYKKGGKRELTQALTYKALDMVELYVVKYSVEFFIERINLGKRLNLPPVLQSGLTLVTEFAASAVVSGTLGSLKQRISLIVPDLIFGKEKPEALA
jgi:hypothetical protein